MVLTVCVSELACFLVRLQQEHSGGTWLLICKLDLHCYRKTRASVTKGRRDSEVRRERKRKRGRRQKKRSIHTKRHCSETTPPPYSALATMEDYALSFWIYMGVMSVFVGGVVKKTLASHISAMPSLVA